MKKYYAVKEGNKRGIFETWEECKSSVNGYKGALYKSFSSYEDALNYLNDKEESLSCNTFAYVDGSYNVKTQEYSFGAILYYEGQMYKFKRKFGPDEYSRSRNVSGEIRGAAFIINYAIKQGIKELDLYYDYRGIEEFYTGAYKASKELPLIYQEFAQNAKKKIKVNFHKVKSHTNNKYNDLVDLLAKEALGL